MDDSGHIPGEAVPPAEADRSSTTPRKLERRAMPLLYVVRHGETDWNRVGRLQGQRDIPLNESGRLQAARNGQALKEIVRDPEGLACVASPLGRTRETMEIIRRTMGLDPHAYRTDDRLKELTLGDWEGLTLAELEKRDPAGYRERRKRRWSVVPPHGESYEMLTGRVSGALAAIESDCLIVAHGGVMRAIRVLLCGVDPQRAPYLPTPQDRVLIIDGGQVEIV